MQAQTARYEPVRARAPWATPALCCLGLAAILALDRLSELVLDPFGVNAGLPRYIGGAASVAAFLAAALVRPGGWGRRGRAGGVRALVVCGVAASVARLAVLFGDRLGVGHAAALMFWCLSKAAESALLLYWVAMACRERPRFAAVLFPAAYAVSICAYLVLGVLGAAAASAVVVALPAASALLAVPYGRRAPDGAEGRASEEAPIASGPQAVAAPGDGRRSHAAGSSWSFPVQPVALMAVCSFFFHFSLCLSDGPGPSGPLSTLAVASLAIAAAVAAPDRYDPCFLYKLALPLLVAGLLTLAFVDGGAGPVFLASAGNNAFMLFILIALSGACQRYGISPVWSFGLVYASSGAAKIAGLAVGAGFIGALPAYGPGRNLVMCAVVVALVVLSTVFFSEEAARRSFGMSPSGRGGPEAALSFTERVVWDCFRASRRYELTYREEEVLELLMGDMTVQQIADATGIAPATVKTHANHIYRKLGVHSRAEAVALVRGTA